MIQDLKKRYLEKENYTENPEHFILCPATKETHNYGSLRLRPVTFYQRIKAINKKLSITFKVTNRRLRKTFCTQLIAKGTPLKVVAELMDHSDLQQLEVYYRHTHHVARKLGDILNTEASDILDAFKGKVIASDQASQSGQQIFAPTKDQSLHLIGSCGSILPCGLNPPLSCYGCQSLEAFDDADHKGVVELFVEETKSTFGESHAIEILKHKDFLAASQFVQKFERGEI